jgi:putative nucleotidyltransferase with HDIG domain
MGIVDALLGALELRHAGTAEHARRVADLALMLTRVIDPDLAEEPGVVEGYLLHDIGKLGVPDAILLKPGSLNALERRLIERHAMHGEKLTRRLRLPPRVHQVVGCHHERWDGSGYPRRLKGEEIPVPARIFSVVDTFDAMTHARPYRDPLSVDETLSEIVRCAGAQFDPRVVDAFLRLATGWTADVKELAAASAG